MEKFNPYQFIQDRKVLRPFNEDGKQDGNWNYLHETDVWGLLNRLEYEKNTVSIEKSSTLCAKNSDTCGCIPPGSCGQDCHGFS